MTYYRLHLKHLATGAEGISVANDTQHLIDCIAYLWEEGYAVMRVEEVVRA